MANKDANSHELNEIIAPVISSTNDDVLANHAYDYTEAEARAVRRKIDIRLMPVLFFTGMISAVDKIVVSNAALCGMTRDL